MRSWANTFLVIGLLFLSIYFANAILSERKDIFKENTTQWRPGIPIAAIGPAKGVLVSSWWMKISRLRMNFEFDEIAKLTSNISFLQPNIPEVWEYLAWNMSFNLLADNINNRPRQVYWLLEGLKHLDKGLIHNPESPILLYSQANTVFMKSTSNPSFEKELFEYLGRDPMQYAKEKAVASQVILNGGYIESLVYIRICLDAGDKPLALEGVEILKKRFPDLAKDLKLF